VESAREFKYTDKHFNVFRNMVAEPTGINLSDAKKDLVYGRLTRRLRKLSLGSFDDYTDYINENTEQELGNFINAITTNLTSFYREEHHFEYLADELLPELIRNNQSSRRIRVWSAGCSSGEEAYSIVAMAMEAGYTPGRDLRVYASDISRSMLTKSRRGVYREASLRETTASRREKYFQEKDGQFRICDEVKRHVDFIHLNLLDRSKIALLGAMDVILCRNVIIYFNIDTKCKVIRTFYEKLRPGGHLLLGHSESLINLSTSFELRHLQRDLVYRRPLPGMAAENPWNIAAAAAIARSDHEGIDE